LQEEYIIKGALNLKPSQFAKKTGISRQKAMTARRTKIRVIGKGRKNSATDKYKFFDYRCNL
jgi:hypothetical protein